MAFEKLMAQVSLLLTQMENQPEDKHELYMQLRERINEIRNTGFPVPADLIRLEQELDFFRREVQRSVDDLFDFDVPVDRALDHVIRIADDLRPSRSEQLFGSGE